MRVSFAVVMAPRTSGAAWADQVREFADLGYRTVCVPDTLRTVSPFPALAAAAAADAHLWLRTWVMAAPMRSPEVAVREVTALQQLSDGRFELGIGTGRPDAAREAAQLGVPWGSGSERLAQLEAVVAAVRERVAPKPPVVMAVSGPKGLATAGRVADRVAVALGARATADDVATGAERIRSVAPDAALTMQFMGVGDQVPEYLARQGISASALRESGSLMILPDDPQEMADVIGHHIAELGVDEVVVPGEYAREVAAGIPLLS